MTSVNVQQKDLHGQQTICQEHVDNNKAVRNMMLNVALCQNIFQQVKMSRK